MISGLSRSADACSAAYVVDGEESVVILAEADPRPLQLLLDEAVAVEIVAVWKGKKEATRTTIGPSASSRT